VLINKTTFFFTDILPEIKSINIWRWQIDSLFVLLLLLLLQTQTNLVSMNDDEFKLTSRTKNFSFFKNPTPKTIWLYFRRTFAEDFLLYQVFKFISWPNHKILFVHFLKLNHLGLKNLKHIKQVGSRVAKFISKKLGGGDKLWSDKVWNCFTIHPNLLKKTNSNFIISNIVTQPPTHNE